MSNFTNNIIYPEFATYTSMKLNSAPEQGTVPPEGYIYQWESIVDNEVYKNYLFHDGTLKQYPLKPAEKTVQIETPDEVSDLIFTAEDVENGVLDVGNNFTISEVGFYTNGNHDSWTVVNIPIVCNSTTSRILFSDVPADDYLYGGIVRFARGTTILNNADNVYKIANAVVGQTFNAEYGLIQVIENTSVDFEISKASIVNLNAGDMMKIFVNNTSGVNVSVDGEYVDNEKFCVCYINMFDSVCRIGEIIDVGE